MLFPPLDVPTFVLAYIDVELTSHKFIKPRSGF